MSDTFADTIGDAKLQRLYDDLTRLRGDRAFVSRADIDPVAFKYILGNLILIDVVHDPLRFRFRLIGTNITLRAGFDLTGRMLDDFPDAVFREFLRRTYTTVVRSRQPLRNERVVDHGHRPYRAEALVVPLSDDGVVINMLLVGIARRDDHEPGALAR